DRLLRWLEWVRAPSQVRDRPSRGRRGRDPPAELFEQSIPSLCQTLPHGTPDKDGRATTPTAIRGANGGSMLTLSSECGHAFITVLQVVDCAVRAVQTARRRPRLKCCFC